MINHNFIIGPSDTDSISFCKADMSPFTIEEQKFLLDEINEISPEFMDWEDDGMYKSCIALRAKNYVLYDGEKKSTKGSAFKTSTKEIALKEFMQELVDEMLNDNNIQTLINIYHKYIKEALNVKDIHRWSSKKTITEAILDCKSSPDESRKNEIDVWNAIKEESDIQEGTKFYVYPVVIGNHVESGRLGKTGKPLKDKVTEISGLRLEKYWKNDHNVDKLIERVYATLKIFKLVLDLSKFIDYSASKNKHLLQQELISSEINSN